MTSVDGTSFPVFLARKRGTAQGPEAPTCLYGDGGFNQAMSPQFRIDHQGWMELGGQLAVACIRGGGVVDCDRKELRGSPGDLWAEQRRTACWRLHDASSQAVRGVLSGCGGVDMLRYHRFTVGTYWVLDYGSADDPEMTPILHATSPVHNVVAGTVYPPTPITTADHDGRVFPAQFKFAAALQAAQAGTGPILLRIDARAGHGLGKPKDKLLDEIADRWAFVFDALDAQPRTSAP